MDHNAQWSWGLETEISLASNHLCLFIQSVNTKAIVRFAGWQYPMIAAIYWSWERHASDIGKQVANKEGSVSLQTIPTILLYRKTPTLCTIQLQIMWNCYPELAQAKNNQTWLLNASPQWSTANGKIIIIKLPWLTFLLPSCTWWQFFFFF